MWRLSITFTEFLIVHISLQNVLREMEEGLRMKEKCNALQFICCSAAVMSCVM